MKLISLETEQYDPAPARTLPESDCIRLELEETTTRRAVSVRLSRDSPDTLRLRVEDADYLIDDVRTHRVFLPATSEDLSLTVATGLYRSATAAGAIAIVVNCARESPELQVMLRPFAGESRAWTWTITHGIQHHVLQMLPAPAAGA